MMIRIEIKDVTTAILHDLESNSKRCLRTSEYNPSLLMDFVDAELKGHAFGDWENARKLSQSTNT